MRWFEDLTQADFVAVPPRPRQRRFPLTLARLRATVAAWWRQWDRAGERKRCRDYGHAWEPLAPVAEIDGQGGIGETLTVIDRQSCPRCGAYREQGYRLSALRVRLPGGSAPVRVLIEKEVRP